MKIAIPYQNGQVFPHFGHAPQFKFYTIESGMIYTPRSSRPRAAATARDGLSDARRR
mgnify:FL=1